MILCINPDLLIFTPPKTGSTSLRDHLCSNTRQGTNILGPQMGGDIDMHTHHLPWVVCKGHLIEAQLLCPIRNPYLRALSLWSHWKTWWKHQADYSFQAFLRKIVIANRADFFSWTITRFAHETRRFNDIKFFNLENVVEQLNEYGLKMNNFPHSNKGIHEGYKDLTDEDLYLINIWAADDFHHGGYAQCTSVNEL
jgi:hypothetical protein